MSFSLPPYLRYCSMVSVRATCALLVRGAARAAMAQHKFIGKTLYLLITGFIKRRCVSASCDQSAALFCSSYCSSSSTVSAVKSGRWCLNMLLTPTGCMKPHDWSLALINVLHMCARTHPCRSDVNFQVIYQEEWLIIAFSVWHYYMYSLFIDQSIM